MVRGIREILGKTLFVRVPVRSYWLIGAYCGFLLFLFMFRNAAHLMGEWSFWVFFATALVGSYAAFRFYALIPEIIRVPLHAGLFLGLSNLFLFDTTFNLFNAFTVICISQVMGAMLYGLRGAVGLALLQSGGLYSLLILQNRGGEVSATNFGELLASLWLVSIFAGIMAEVFHEKTKENARLHEQIERQERLSALGELTGGLAHELRNPLLIIKGAGELIAEGSDPEEAKELGQYIIGEVQRMNGLITSLLDFAKPEKMDLAVMDINDPLEKAVGEVRLFIESGKRDIKVHYQRGGSATILGDKIFLHQAFLNFLLNAVEAIPTVGQIWIKVSKDPDSEETILELRDNGIGISSQDIKKIFNPFFTLRQKGFGLGLSVTQRILDAHGARTFVESELGMGTSFRVQFPLPAQFEKARGVIDLES